MEPQKTDLDTSLETSGQQDYQIGASQWKLFCLVLILGGAGAVFSFLRHSDFYNSGAVYVGMPVALALTLSLTQLAKTAVSATMKGITLALLLAAPVFSEGYICILFSAPIFYFFGFLIALAVQWAKKRHNSRRFHQSAFMATIVALMALEGTTDLTSFPREHTIAVTKIVAAPLGDIRKTLAEPAVFNGEKPLFLKLFPYPAAMTGSGLKIGDARRIKFIAYKHVFWNKVEGEAVFKITEASDRKIVFKLASDTSYIGHYVDWKMSEIGLQPIGPTKTRVTWTLSFHRKYDPYWYFATLQKYAVKLAAEELIDHAATPGA